MSSLLLCLYLYTLLVLHLARRSVLNGSWVLIPVSAMFFLIGTALYYYKVNPRLLKRE